MVICKFCKGTRNGCGKPGDCPYCVKSIVKAFRPMIGMQVVVVGTRNGEDIVEAEGEVTNISGNWVEVRDRSGRRDEWPMEQIDDPRAWR